LTPRAWDRQAACHRQPHTGLCRCTRRTPHSRTRSDHSSAGKRPPLRRIEPLGGPHPIADLYFPFFGDFHRSLELSFHLPQTGVLTRLATVRDVARHIQEFALVFARGTSLWRGHFYLSVKCVSTLLTFPRILFHRDLLSFVRRLSPFRGRLGTFALGSHQELQMIHHFLNILGHIPSAILKYANVCTHHSRCKTS
jgi:hypothetical protein